MHGKTNANKNSETDKHGVQKNATGRWKKKKKEERFSKQH